MKLHWTLGILILGLSLQGAFYYVSPEGNDKFPGTSPDKPLKSLKQALYKARSGDTVMVKGGIYREELWREWRTGNQKPITVKAFPDETPVITFGWSVKNWKKLPGGLFAADFPYAVCDLWQRLTLDRFLRVDSMELLQKQPGAFFQDPRSGKLYVNPFNGSWHDDPEKAGFTAIPYGTGRTPLPFDTKATRFRRSGLSVVGNNLVFEGLSFEFHGASGFSIRGRKMDNFYGSVRLRNCSAIGTTLGFGLGWFVGDSLIENCSAIRNSGSGIQLGNYIKNIRVINNFLLDNGSCMPFYGNYTNTSGNVFNLSRYGGAEADNVDIIGNKVISLDKSRHGGVMRCKGGIRKHTNQLNNIFVGGGVSLYSVPGSTATLRNNTVMPGKFHFTVPTSGQKYTPDMKDNLELSWNWQRSGRFVNPQKHDYRLLPDSPCLGKGSHPAAAPVWFVKAGAAANGSGRTPESPLNSLKALQSRIKSGDTVYFLPGTYSGELVLKNVKNVLLSDMTYDSAKFLQSQITVENSQNVRIENLEFHKSRFAFDRSEVVFKESFLAASRFEALKGKSVFENSRLEALTLSSSGRVVLRENLMDKVKVSSDDVVSEHNGFMTQAEVEKWPFKETFKSFAAGVNGRVPLQNRLCGSRGTWIGGRRILDRLPPVEVEYLKILPLECGTKVLVTWNTPKDYVYAVTEVFDGKKRVFSHRGSFGSYLTTSGEVCISNLQKNKTYTLHVLLRRHNESKGWFKKTVFTTASGSAKHTPALIKAGKGTLFPSVAAALLAARKGDTVFIEPGVYPEMLNVYTDDLTIKAKPGTVKISGASMFDFCLKASNVKNLTLDGLDFIGLRYSSKTRAVEILKSSGIKIINCRFFPNNKGGISNVQLFGQHVKGFEVRNCVFNSGFHAVWLMEAEDVTVDHNTFWGIGINAIHVGGGPGAKVVITNNLSQDVVSNHNSPAVSIGHPGTKYICDWNLYWKTDKKCPGQKIFGIGGKIGTAAAWQIMNSDITGTIEETRKRFNIEKNGLYADPRMKDPGKGDFSLAPDSPARKRGSDGKDIGADLSVFSVK